MILTKEQEALLRSLNNRLAKYIEIQNKPVWVNTKIVKEQTGWNRVDMISARAMGWVKYRENKTGSYEYDLNSIHERFIIKK